MMHHVRSATVCAAAILVVLIAASAASANRLSFSQSSFRIIWSSMGFVEGAGAVYCPVTLEGFLHERTAAKVAGQLLGFLTRASLASEQCRGGSATMLPGPLPGHIQYLSFSGSLPSISEIDMAALGLGISIRSGLFFSCLALIDAFDTAVLRFPREAGGQLTNVLFDVRYPIDQEGTFCEESLTITGSGSMTVLGGREPVRLGLI